MVSISMDEAIACGQASAPSQKPDRPRRPHGVLSRDEVLELGRKAREAIFPPHESEIGLMRGTPSVVHGVVSARATGARRPQWADEAGATASSAWTRESRRRKGIHCGGPRFSKPHLSKPRPNSSEGKPKKSLSIAVPPAEGMQGPTGEGCLSARGTAVGNEPCTAPPRAGCRACIAHQKGWSLCSSPSSWRVGGAGGGRPG